MQRALYTADTSVAWRARLLEAYMRYHKKQLRHIPLVAKILHLMSENDYERGLERVFPIKARLIEPGSP